MSNPPIKQKYIESPEAMEQLFEDYKTDLKEQAKEWVKVQYVGKEGERVTDEYKLPMSMDGFEVFCFKKVGTIEHYFRNETGSYDSYCTICSYIKKEIRSNQITGGLLGLFNPSITQRLNGLKEQTETEIKGTLNVPGIPDIGNRK